MAAVMEERDQQALRRRNIRLALGIAVAAVCCYVGMFVVYLMAAGR